MADRDLEQEQTSATLGNVLYAGGRTGLIPEFEWVALVRSISAGHHAALHALYARAHRPVFTLILRLVAKRETAEELTLDVFHDVWRRAARYDPDGGTVLGWIMNQARSRAIDRLRFEQRKKRHIPHADEPTRTAVGPAPQDLLTLQQHSETLRNALTLLTPEQRNAIEQAFFYGLSYEEQAARSNQPLETIKTRIRSGLHKLRQVLVDGSDLA